MSRTRRPWTWRSAHALDKSPTLDAVVAKPVGDKLVGLGLSGSFTRAIGHSRDLATA